MIDNDEKAKAFIKRLSHLTEEILSAKVDAALLKDNMKSLEELFDSFAVVDEFNSFLIADCYNEIKISLMKWKRFADKASVLSREFKLTLDKFYEVMKDLYFYEIFGFFSTTVHPEDFPEVNLPCKVFCGCADGWQREPRLDANGKVDYIDVVRFQDPKNKEVPLCITIENPHLLEEREKCSLNDEQLKTLFNFVNQHRGSIILHNAGVIDSKQFIDSLRLRGGISKAKYCVEFECIKHIKTEPRLTLSSGAFYVDMDDMTYREAQKFYSKIWEEMTTEPDNLQKSYRLLSLKILKYRPPINTCCFCGVIMSDYGNSTWPIYYKQDGEKHRCCDECNEKYVIPARKDRSLIMRLRNQFGIDYTEYKG